MCTHHVPHSTSTWGIINSHVSKMDPTMYIEESIWPYVWIDNWVSKLETYWISYGPFLPVFTPLKKAQWTSLLGSTQPNDHWWKIHYVMEYAWYIPFHHEQPCCLSFHTQSENYIYNNKTSHQSSWFSFIYM